jgi:hypothetical protein
MYPDQHDVELALQQMRLNPRPKPEDIWEDVVLVRSFLDEARGRCYNYGRHNFILISELKTIAENYIGRAISNDALTVAMRMQQLQVKSSGSSGVLLVKLRPLDRFEEVHDLWNQHQKVLQREIQMERESIALRQPES